MFDKTLGDGYLFLYLIFIIIIALTNNQIKTNHSLIQVDVLEYYNY